MDDVNGKPLDVVSKCNQFVLVFFSDYGLLFMFWERTLLNRKNSNSCLVEQ